MKKCRYADEYKGIYPPRCNGGDPCEVCREKYITIDDCYQYLERNFPEEVDQPSGVQIDRMRTPLSPSEIHRIRKLVSEERQGGL